MAESKKVSKTSNPPGQIMDVAHPGQSAPAGNSKSVIITHRPIMQDPMVVAGEGGDAPQPGTSGPSLHKANLQPTTAPLLETAGKKAATTEPAPQEDETPALIAVSEPAEATEPEPATPVAPKVVPDPPVVEIPSENEKPTEESSSTVEKTKSESDSADLNSDVAPETANTKAIKPPSDDSKNTEDPTAGEDAVSEQEAKLQKLVDSKQYYLPINAQEKRRTKRFIALGILLSFVLIIAWIDISLDAGLVHIDGIKPITHFFST